MSLTEILLSSAGFVSAVGCFFGAHYFVWRAEYLRHKEIEFFVSTKEKTVNSVLWCVCFVFMASGMIVASKSLLAGIVGMALYVASRCFNELFLSEAKTIEASLAIEIIKHDKQNEEKKSDCCSGCQGCKCRKEERGE